MKEEERKKNKLDPKEIDRSRQVVLDYIGGKTREHGSTKTHPVIRQGALSDDRAKHKNKETLKQSGNLKKSETKKGQEALVNSRSGGLPLAGLFKKIEPGKFISAQKQIARRTRPDKDIIDRYRLAFLIVILALLIILLEILLI